MWCDLRSRPVAAPPGAAAGRSGETGTGPVDRPDHQSSTGL
jgi:hypothetical protein